MKNPRKEFFDILEMYFMSSKKPEMKFGDFLFQVREPPAPLNIPTPTLAPDHLLGGHPENLVLFVFFF